MFPFFQYFKIEQEITVYFVEKYMTKKHERVSSLIVFFFSININHGFVALLGLILSIVLFLSLPVKVDS